ncbi:hypothetical protein EVAR_84775_1 [Eumeta japonica]|uniref:Uncharacterized protein n=1 Tax=Eumeta variegata TaxID=151549 RepID=A0A4C1U8U5_EUMVA|nr:hypothetical protein EVAR_84775_1 [Eumeta japonica]
MPFDDVSDMKCDGVLLPGKSYRMGLMMEPEGKHRKFIMKQRILAVFGLVEIVLRCTLIMNDFQGLMMQPERRH